MKMPIEISTTYARLILQSELLPQEVLLEGSEQSREDFTLSDYMDWQLLATMFRNIDKHVDISPAWAAHLGGRFSTNSHGPLGFAALSAPTLGAAVEAMAEFYPARVTAIATQVEVYGDRYVMELNDTTGDRHFSGFLAEIILKVIESLLASILGHPVGESVIVSLMRTQPADVTEFQSAYDAHLEFGASAHSISIPVTWWLLPSPLHDESMYWANIEKCRELITSRENPDSAEITVRTVLKNYFDARIAGRTDARAPPTQDMVAEKMHLTTRTLIRRLKREDSAYKGILEELRRNYAQTLLGNARLTVADIGELLGYREPANFGRAFRRWFGIAPAAWRRQ